MKNAIMYCFALVAMACAMFVTPAMAAEGWEGFAPVAVHADVMPAIVVIDDLPMLTEQSARPQPEAVVVMGNKSENFGSATFADYRPGYAIPTSGPFEHGWRPLS